jgi:hypothetical protein
MPHLKKVGDSSQDIKNDRAYYGIAWMFSPASNFFAMPYGFKTISPRRPFLKRIGLVVLVTLLFPMNDVCSQQAGVPHPACLLSTLPFQVLNGGTILVKIQLGNYPDSLNFIFDTGSDGISLDSATCERLHMDSKPSDKTVKGIAGIRSVRFVYNERIRLPDLEVDSVDLHVNDYGILTSAYGDNVDGILGNSFLSRFIVKIDYDSSKIYLYSKGPIKYPRGGFLSHPVIVSLPVESARVKENADILARFYFDTGAGLCLLFSSDFVNDSTLFSTKKREPVETLAQGPGGKTSMKQTTVKDFRFGPYHFRNVPAYIFEDQYNVTSYPSMAGLIGNDLLRRFNIILNYPKREIYLVPNSHFRDLFDYSYTGLTILLEDGEIRVADVIRNSPAYKAGLKEDDVIVGVDNNFTGNMQAYKKLLQTVGEKVRVYIRRKNELIELKIRVQSIF